MIRGALLLSLVLVPLLGAVLASFTKTTRAARWLGAVAVGVTLAAAALLTAQAVSADVSALSIGALTVSLAFDGSAAVLAVTVALVHVGALVFTERRTVSPSLVRALLVAEAGTMLGICAGGRSLFAIGWALSLAPLLAAPLTAGPARLMRRSAAISIAFVLLATSLDSLGGDARAWPASIPISSIAWVVAALARMGASPLHAWAPVALHRAPVALSVPTITSPLPVLALVQSMEGSAAPDFLGWLLVVVGTGGALYGAALAMVQNDLRRSIGYVQCSFASTLVAAIGTGTRVGALGAILGVVAGAIAISGLAFLAGAIAARTGTCDMRRLGGLHRSSPIGSAIFLLSGVAIVGFPGTIGFVSEELVMQGLVGGHPLAAAMVLVAAALNAVTLFRCYERTYLGPSSQHGPHEGRVEDLLPRERWTAMVWAALIVIGGFVPAPLMAIESALPLDATETSAAEPTLGIDAGAPSPSVRQGAPATASERPSAQSVPRRS
jgi:NADH-quinone oxidoreductase subunit M